LADARGAYLLFDLSGQRYGLPVGLVREVTPVVLGVSLPEPPPMVESAIDYHGQIIAVLDVRRRFGLPAKPVDLRDHLIVCEAVGRTVALRVDQVLELADIPAEAIAQASDAIPGVGQVAGIARTPDGLVLIHDLSTFLSEAEHRLVAEALAATEAGASL
jgi:purine-binding chemotaxis protein CheW